MVCRRCHSVNDDSSKVCAACGQRLKVRWWLVTGICLSVALWVALVWVVLAVGSAILKPSPDIATQEKAEKEKVEKEQRDWIDSVCAEEITARLKKVTFPNRSADRIASLDDGTLGNNGKFYDHILVDTRSRRGGAPTRIAMGCTVVCLRKDACVVIELAQDPNKWN